MLTANCTPAGYCYHVHCHTRLGSTISTLCDVSRDAHISQVAVAMMWTRHYKPRPRRDQGEAEALIHETEARPRRDRSEVSGRLQAGLET